MGQNQSDAIGEVAAEIPESVVKAPSNAIKLYQYVGKEGAEGSWTTVTKNAEPNFYNANEDNGKKKPDWYFEVGGSDIDVRIDSNLSYSAELNKLLFNFSAHGSVWGIKFGMEEQYRAFMQEFMNHEFENLSGRDNDEANRAKELGDDYAEMFYNVDYIEKAAQPMDVDEPDEPEPATTSAFEEKEAMLHDEDDDDQDTHIQGLIIGAGENNYLMRGKKFEVLRNVVGGIEDKNMSFTLTPAKSMGRGLGAVATPTLTPSRVLLAHSERNMIMLTPDQRDVLHQANIETGQVVTTWKFNKNDVDIPMKDIHHDDKAAQMTDASTFLGLDANRLARWDMRDPHGVVQHHTPILDYTGGKDYSRGTNFNCMATSGDGYVAVGSQDGKIRLYNSSTLTQAKTAIPGLGSAITSIDVTYDGKWVLATTDKYLMLVKTTYEDDKGKPANAFTSKMGRRGAPPRLLRLKPEDMCKTGNKAFAKGKFTWITESGNKERWIVAQCGKYSVVWNFRRIKSSTAESVGAGGMVASTDYTLTMGHGKEVVEAAFLHHKYARAADMDAMVVATENTVFNIGA